jgi:molecular chaperone DnaK
VLQGERDVASGNKSLGQFNLEGIPPAPRGMPQIEVMFDIDANGILHVSARDKATGKENKITIRANSGLSEDEIQKMVKDAEAHAEDDRKLMETVQARNSLDALVHSVNKSLAEYGDKIGADEKGTIEAAVKGAEELLKQKDAEKDKLTAKSEELAKAAQKLGEIMYAQAQAASGGGAGHEAGAGGPGGDAHAAGGGKSEEKVVDAEFTEVKSDKK